MLGERSWANSANTKLISGVGVLEDTVTQRPERQSPRLAVPSVVGLCKRDRERGVRDDGGRRVTRERWREKEEERDKEMEKRDKEREGDRGREE